MTNQMTMTEHYWLVRRHFASTLKAKREGQGFSVQQVCLVLRVKEHTYRTWERGEHAPDLKMLQRICVLLKTSPSDLLPASEVNADKS